MAVAPPARVPDRQGWEGARRGACAPLSRASVEARGSAPLVGTHPAPLRAAGRLGAEDPQPGASRLPAPRQEGQPGPRQLCAFLSAGAPGGAWGANAASAQVPAVSPGAPLAGLARRRRHRARAQRLCALERAHEAAPRFPEAPQSPCPAGPLPSSPDAVRGERLPVPARRAGAGTAPAGGRAAAGARELR